MVKCCDGPWVVPADAVLILGENGDYVTNAPERVTRIHREECTRWPTATEAIDAPPTRHP